MGQTVSSIQTTLQGKEEQIKSIADRVFDRIKGDSEKQTLNLDDLNVAILYVYNDINKYLPGHNDPPTKDELQALLKEFDLNLDNELSREEFVGFVKKITKDIATSVGRNLFIALVAAPTVAILTKKSTEGVPVVGKTVEKIPSSVYASAVAAAVLLLQNISQQ